MVTVKSNLTFCIIGISFFCNYQIYFWVTSNGSKKVDVNHKLTVGEYALLEAVFVLGLFQYSIDKHLYRFNDDLAFDSGL